MLCELACTDCNSSFTSAASLLQHFAEHASKLQDSGSSISTDEALENELEHNVDIKQVIKSEVNNVSIYQTLSESSVESLVPMVFDNHEEENIDSGVEDVNPLQYCTVSLKTDNHGNLRKKYDCTFCLKSFGWSTDLKRHILIHTGERPFQCCLCDASFTRKFLLQKHLAKVHHNKEFISNESNAQSQHDMYLKQKSRKQDKQSIKHNPKISNTVIE